MKEGDVLSEIKDQYELHYFSKDLLALKTKSTTRQRKFNRQQIRNFLKDPIKNYDKLQQVSAYLKSTSGNYFRILKYLSGILTFDYLLYPDLKPNKMDTDDSKDKVKRDFEKVAKLVHKMNLKHNLRWMLEKVIEDGEIYLYKLEDSKGIVYKDFPTQFCRVSAIDDGVLRYQIDINQLKDDTVLEFPLEIQNAYKKYKNNKNSIPDGWYQVSDKGVAFNTIGSYPHSYPLLSFMFDDIMGLEDTKDLFEEQEKLDAIKLIHQKIPLDKEGKKPIFDGEATKTFHEATKRNLPGGVAVTTNPFDVSNIPLDKARVKDLDSIERAEKNIWNSAGISDLIFNNNKASGEALKRSIVADESLVMPFLTMFANYINKEIQSSKWSLKFMETTYFNRDDKLKAAKDLLSYGGSRFYLLSLNGFEPLEIVNLLNFEQEILDIDSILISKDTSFTQSGGDIGRPMTDDPTPNTEKDRERK